MSGSPKDNMLLQTLLERLEKRVYTLERGAPLRNATVTKGGLTIKDGGNLVLDSGGDFFIYGGSFASFYSDRKTVATYLGPLPAPYNQGFVLNDTNGGSRVWIAKMANGNFNVAFGASTTAPEAFIDAFDVDAVAYSYLKSPDFRAGNFDTNKGLILQGSNAWLQGLTTTSSAANMVVDAATGFLQRSTSSRRYKCDIKDVKIDVEKVLALKPKQHRDRVEVAAGTGARPTPDGMPAVIDPRTHISFMAEDAHKAGLGAWVGYDEKDRPDSFDYAKFTVAQQAVLIHHHEEIKSLKAENEALKSELKSLKTTVASLATKLNLS